MLPLLRGEHFYVLVILLSVLLIIQESEVLTPADDIYHIDKASFNTPYDLVLYVGENGKLPVLNFAAGGIATPADAALMMQLGCDGVFVGSGI